MAQKTFTIAAQQESDDFVAAFTTVFNWDGEGSGEDFAWACVQKFISDITQQHKHQTMKDAVASPPAPTVVLS